MAVFTTGTISSIVQGGTSEDDRNQEMEAPLIGSIRSHSRTKKRKSKWQRPAYYVSVAILVAIVAGIFVLSQRYGGDKVAQQAAPLPMSDSAPLGVMSNEQDEAQDSDSAKLAQKHIIHAKAQKRAAAAHLAAPRASKPNPSQDPDSESQKDYAHYLDAKHSPKHTLGEALRKSPEEEHRGRHHDLHGGEYKAKSSFAQEYAQYLAKEHPIQHTLHGTGLHPDTYHPSATAASHGDSFSRWLDRTHPVEAHHPKPPSPPPHDAPPARRQEDPDRTGQSGHFGKGWYHTHNLHSDLESETKHVSSAREEKALRVAQERDREHEEERERAMRREHRQEARKERVKFNAEDHARVSFGHEGGEKSEAAHEADIRARERAHAEKEAEEDAREDAEERASVSQHRNPKTAQHLTLHERNQMMEGKRGHYAFLSPQQRWAREEYDAIEDAKKTRAKAAVGLKHLRDAMHHVEHAAAAAHLPFPLPSGSRAEERSEPPQRNGWEGDGGDLGKYKGNSGGVLSEVPKDEHLAGGVLSNFDEGDRPAANSRTVREANGVLSQVKAAPNNGNWLEGIGAN